MQQYKNQIDENSLEKEMFKPLRINDINLENLNNDIVFKACKDKYGGYWVSLLSHKFINTPKNIIQL